MNFIKTGIIDNDESIHRMLNRTLSNQGYDIVFSVGSEDEVQTILLEENKPDVDAVILDAYIDASARNVLAAERIVDLLRARLEDIFIVAMIGQKKVQGADLSIDKLQAYTIGHILSEALKNR